MAESGDSNAFKSIVISGLPASGKTTLAANLAKHFGWKVYSLGGLWREKYAQQYPKGEISFAEFWSKTSIEDNRVMNTQAKVLFEAGSVIGDSRFTFYLDPSKCLLVLLQADINIRVERALSREEYKGMSEEEIKQNLERREADEVKMGKELFDKDFRDYKGYHIVLNSGLMTVEQELDAVLALFEAKG